VPDRTAVEGHVRAWLKEFVVGLNLCPFASPLLDSPQLRIAICEETSPAVLQRAFLSELDLLQSSPESEIATIVLVFPGGLADFEEYLSFLEQAQSLLIDAGLEGLVQLASFHPAYCFDGEDPEGPSHFSNRAPYPAIHLLREDMLSRVLGDFPNADLIPQRNIETLEKIGREELVRRWRALFA
jgi:hypothetical protein